MVKPWNNMLFSSMQRHVMIFTVVTESDAFLSASDRLSLIRDLISRPTAYTPETIESECNKLSELNLECNMTNAQILRTAQRGY